MAQIGETQAVGSPKKILVAGLGISGRSVCALLLSRGARVTATDLRSRASFNGALDPLEEKGCILRLGSHAVEDFLDADQIILSPGVPLDIEPLRAARKAGREIVGELEWAWRQVDLPVVAVTGTNGKTTTTALIGEMLRGCGLSPFVGGNIGTPLSQWILSGGRAGVLVLEVSSFQLDTAPRFRAEVGVLLNVTEDHLDRYSGFEEYIESKFSLFARSRPGDTAILNGYDPICIERAEKLAGRVLTFSRKDRGANAWIDGPRVNVSIPGREPFSLGLENCRLKGAHNEENIMAAALAAACAANSTAGVLQDAIERFKGFPHRVEWVRTWKGADFYDDSKATNVGAVAKALENFDCPVLLLLGGRDKMGSYEPLAGPVRSKVKGIYAFGEAGPRIYRDLGRYAPSELFPDMESAFGAAAGRVLPGEAVLLSPACSSFDQYESYARRGDHFKRLAAALPD